MDEALLYRTQLGADPGLERPHAGPGHQRHSGLASMCGARCSRTRRSLHGAAPNRARILSGSLRRLWSARSSTSRTRTVSTPRLLGGSGDAGQLLGRAGGDRGGSTKTRRGAGAPTRRAIVCVLPPEPVRMLVRYSPALRGPSPLCEAQNAAGYSSDGSLCGVDHSLTAIMLGGAARGQRSCGSHLGQPLRELRDKQQFAFGMEVGCSSGQHGVIARILARSALVWMEDALETRTITAPNRCHRSRLDHRVCGRPARNRVLVRCSPDRSRTVDHHPTITVNPILPISRSPDRISSTPHAPRPREAKRPCESLGSPSPGAGSSLGRSGVGDVWLAAAR